MFLFAGRSGLVLLSAALCLGAPTADAQTAPVTYWIPGWPIGFGGDLSASQSAATYGNFPSFDGSDARGGGFFFRRTDFSGGAFVSGPGGGPGLSTSGLNRFAAFGNNSLYSEGMQFGYKLQNTPLAIYGGFDTLKNNPGIGGASALFDSTSGTVSGYTARAGVEFQPAPNVSLSLGFGYTQLQSGRVDSDINSPLLPGATPSAFSSGRR